jgi:hypothetical protein
MEPAPANSSPTLVPGAIEGTKLKYLLILLIAFLGKFLFASGFGFYEDDYLQILPFYQLNLGDAIARAWFDLRVWPHGEPIGFAISDLHAYFVTRFDSLLPAFLLGLLLVALNGCLFYRLARRWFSDFPSFIAACVFVLYPADTSEQIIMNQPWQLMNLTFVLLAFLFYRKHIVLAYGLALCSLLTYEHFFFPFAAAPFLLERGERFSVKKCLSHGFFIVASATGMILTRNFIGESRAQDVLASPGQVFTKIPSAIALGLENSIGTLGARVSDSLFYGGISSYGIILMTAFALVLVFRKKSSGIEQPEEVRTPRDLLIIAGGALFAAAAGYVLAFRPDDYPPILNLGRISGFNAPASIGVCILIGCIISVGLRLGPIIRETVAWLSVGVVGCLVAVGIYIQKVDYVDSWTQQRTLLQQLFATSNTWKPDTVLVIDLDNSDKRSVSTPGFPIYWLYADLAEVPAALMHITAFQELTKGKHACPVAVPYSRDVGSVIAEPGGVKLEWPSLRPVHVQDGNFQLFQIHHGQLMRVQDPTWSIAGMELHQQVLSPTQQWPLPLSKAGMVLLHDQPRESLWPSVDNGIMYPTTPPFSRSFPKGLE